MYKKLSIFLLCLTNTSCSHLCKSDKECETSLEDHFKTMKKEEVKNMRHLLLFTSIEAKQFTL